MGLLEKAESIKKLDSNDSVPTPKGGLLSKALEASQNPKPEETINEALPNLPFEDSTPNEKEAPLEIKEENPPIEPLTTYDSSEEMFDEWEKEAKDQASRTEYQDEDDDINRINNDFLNDDDHSTEPESNFGGSKRKIENLFTIIELSKELSANSATLESVLEDVLYGIVGQLGTEPIFIYGDLEGNHDEFNLIVYEGGQSEIHPNLNKKSKIISIIENSQFEIQTAHELMEKGIDSKEEEWLLDLQSEVIIPISYDSELFGVISLGKPLHDEHYPIEDLEFLKHLGQLAGALYHRAKDWTDKEEEILRLKEAFRLNKIISHKIKLLSKSKSLDDAFDLINDTLRKQLNVKDYSLFLLDSISSPNYKLFSSTIISPERMKEVLISKESDLIQLISNVWGIYNINEFQSHPTISQILRSEELAQMREFEVIPMISMDWLIGFWVVHNKEGSWNNIDRQFALETMEQASPVISNFILTADVESVFKNPFLSIQDKIESEIQKSKRLGLPFTVSVFKIQNASRMIQVLGQEYFSQFSQSLIRSIQDNLGPSDLLFRLGMSKVGVIHSGVNRKEEEERTNKIQRRFHEILPPREDYRTSYRCLSLTYPKDTREGEELLELLEES
jgi:GGDEF domain-containing protein